MHEIRERAYTVPSETIESIRMARVAQGVDAMDGVVFVDANGAQVEAADASYVLLTQDRFRELAAGRLLDAAMEHDRRAVAAELRDATMLKDMARALAPDPLGPAKLVKLGRKERRAEERRRRRGGR